MRSWSPGGAAAICLAWCSGARAEAAVQARVWRPSAGVPGPELADDPDLRHYLSQRRNFGIAVAGGGTRGMFVAHGAVRALRKAGILSKARYLSTTSGSIWLGILMYYQKLDSLDDFLGESLPPEALTPDVLVSAKSGTAVTRLSFFRQFPEEKGDDRSTWREGNVSGLGDINAAEGEDAFEALLRHSAAERSDFFPKELRDWPLGCDQSQGDLCSCLMAKALPGTLEGLYGIATGIAFLQPFGLATPFSSHCHSTQLERVRSQLGSHATIYDARDMSQGLPFLLSQSAVMAPYTGRDGKPLLTFPLEHTPLYTGTAQAYNGSEAFPYKGLGDVLIESFAWPGAAEEPVSSSPESSIRVSRRHRLLNLGQLAEWSGIATSYIADFQIRPWAFKLPECLVAAGEKILPHATVWSPLYKDEAGIPVSQSLPVADAGVYDDLGHIPLLRRRVSKMVVFDSSAVHDNATGHDMDNPCEMVYLLAAFGQPGCLNPANPAGSPNPMMERDALTVFRPTEFGPVWAKLKAARASGRPAVVRGKFTVVDNPRFGIIGGWQAEVLWVSLFPVAEWRSRLPRSSAEKLAAFFPNYLAGEVESHFEFGALSQLSSWLTEQAVVGEVQKMLNGEDAETTVLNDADLHNMAFI